MEANHLCQQDEASIERLRQQSMFDQIVRLSLRAQGRGIRYLLERSFGILA